MKRQIEELLHRGEYEFAYKTLLDLIEKKLVSRAASARTLVDLAEFYSLYGRAEAEPWQAALEEARVRWRPIETKPLYQSLTFELAALRGEKIDMPSLTDPRAKYHLAQGVAYLGYMSEALELLPESPATLPLFLQSRLLALRARLLESVGNLASAASFHEQAAEIMTSKEALWSLLDATALRLDSGDLAMAAVNLKKITRLLPNAEISDRATFHYLAARVELAGGNPELALPQITQAEGLEAASGGLSHGTAMVRAQIHQRLGQHKLVRNAYREAERRAAESDLPYIWHEWGVAELEAGQIVEAEKILSWAVESKTYPFMPQLLADLAEVYYRLGNGPAAEDTAMRSLALHPTAAAHLVLGNRAYDIGHWDEALAHYRAAAALAHEGEHDWITAVELTVDVLAQMGFPNPVEAAELAERVIPYLPASDEWKETMQNYAVKARLLDRKNRLLN